MKPSCQVYVCACLCACVLVCMCACLCACDCTCVSPTGGSLTVVVESIEKCLQRPAFSLLTLPAERPADPPSERLHYAAITLHYRKSRLAAGPPRTHFISAGRLFTNWGDLRWKFSGTWEGRTGKDVLSCFLTEQTTEQMCEFFLLGIWFECVCVHVFVVQR